MSLNKSILVGRLTKDLELKITPSGKHTCNFTVAVNRTFANANGEREADFINCVAWGRTAENMAAYVGKGSLVGVDGRIQTRNYDNQQGQKVYVTEVVAENVQFLDSKSATREMSSSTDDGLSGLDISDDELPF